MNASIRLASTLLPALVFFGGTSCASKSSSPDDIIGDWHGTYKDVSGNTGNIDATFTQNGSTLGGNILLGWSCSIANSASVNGTITGNDFSASMVYGFTTVNIKATRSGQSVSGTFTISGGICNGDAGTFTLGR
jgi:hypothetical protein